MIKNSRQAEIMNILEQSSYASVEQLAKLTYASEPTIRRDLIYLEAKGYVVRNHGGAMVPQKENSVLPAAVRNAFNQKQKKLLCQEAAKLLRDNMTVFLDESTTLAFLVKHLPKFKDLKIITNSLQTSILLNNLNLNFLCTGGKIVQQNYFSGPQTEKFIRAFNADICFFSSTSISSDGVISDNSEYKISTMEAMLSQSRRRIYLCDDSKINSLSMYNLTTINQIDKVYTTAQENTFTFQSDKIVYVPAD